ncbi:molecular chaperone DnaJ [Candidatus Tachikawaea gelatinosa]|uniref:Chaperone protein DnaJ n=1 Tax=Candidatus Tachikawaea gelatinosa TaxID=1410383 RepID=A0A090AMC2_9ENTR|nr:molecular chaperone DnaJ [Candidatus Tachikawaea gelatinosa]BAP58794.1 chaperone protein DnaJ [Candidatus Tachikawaea gelatinosa]
MSKKNNYYEILNISNDADERQIKKAYKRLAMKYHPDRNPDDKKAESKFKEIKKAYEILIDPKKRAAYDQYGDSAFEQGSNNTDNSSSYFNDIFGDVFGDIFGGGKKQHNERHADVQYNIEMSLEEAVKGISKEINIKSIKECYACYGSGSKMGKKPENCRTCHGSGQIQMRQGFFTLQQSCPTCQGRGSIIRNPCNICGTRGYVDCTKKINVRIPAGVDTNDRIRVNYDKGKGKYAALMGDIFVQIFIKKHPIFNREDNNLSCEIPISFSMAALGGEIEVPTLDGRVKLKIPSETQTGKLFRIRGKGIKSIRKRSLGDLFCRVIIETPINLNEKQKNLLRELNYSLVGPTGEKNSPKSKRFFESVKKFFDDLTN